MTHRTFARAGVLALSLMALAPAAQAQQNLKFAYINSQVLLSNAPGRAEAQAQLEKELAAYRLQVQRMGDSLNALIADYRKQEAVLSPVARESRQKTITTREEEYQKRAQQMQEQAQQRNEALMQPIFERIQRVLEQVRAEDGYTMIFDVAASNGLVVAADRNLDITEQVSARLKAAGTARGDTGTTNRPRGAPAGAPAGVQPKKPPQQ